jgi:nucleoside-diphosphate-sugar epimerase
VIGIIGGTGFIGLNLSWHLQKEGLPCRTFSRNGLLLNPKSIYYSQLSKIEHVKGHLFDEAAVREFVRPCRSIVMLVSHLLPSSSPEEIRSVISWFGAAFVQLLEACRGSRVDQIVFVSFKRANNNQGIIDHYVRSARAKRPFTIFGDGNEIRDYIYIDDISTMITAVVDTPPSNSVFNVGTGRRTPPYFQGDHQRSHKTV